MSDHKDRKLANNKDTQIQIITAILVFLIVVIVLAIMFVSHGCSAVAQQQGLNIDHAEQSYRDYAKCVKKSMGRQVHKLHGDHWDIDPPYNTRPLERFTVECEK